MTIPPIQGSGASIPPFRIPVLTAPVSTGVPPLIGDDPLLTPQGAPPSQPGLAGREDPPISLAGRLDTGNVLPETTQLALALESATRALQNGRADLVLTELDAVWSDQLAADSPWYLRTAALQLLGRMGDAEQVIRDGIGQLPRSAALLYLLGVHTAYRGQTDAARIANDHALALHPTEPLLWLQRAALAQNSGMADTVAALLEHAQSLDPSFPASNWLATLARLGEGRGRTPTPVMQRAIPSLTPSGVPVIRDDAPPPQPSSMPLTLGVLATAVRYGLTMLESPTQSARAATHVTASGNVEAIYAEMLSAAAQPPVRAEFPSWEALVLTGSLIVLAIVPPLRIPALMLSGAMLMVLVSRKGR
jgi:tetratricopeptide (TPR) repeat protein